MVKHFHVSGSSDELRTAIPSHPCQCGKWECLCNSCMLKTSFLLEMSPQTLWSPEILL